jgi:hypothetical protein
MTQYQAKSPNSLVYSVTKDEVEIGKLNYQSWFKFNAEIELGDHTKYRVEPKGFWGTTIEVKDGDNVVIQFSMNWKGEVVIQRFFGGIEYGYIFKHQGFFKETFVLVDTESVQLLVMKPLFKWKKMSYEYEIVIADPLEELPQKDLLLMVSLHCANYYVSMMSASMGG